MSYEPPSDNRTAVAACKCPELQSNFARSRAPNNQQVSTEAAIPPTSMSFKSIGQVQRRIGRSAANTRDAQAAPS
jgi:hypothetical protein